MRTIILIALIVGVLVAVALAVRFDGRVSIGSYSPVEVAEGARIEMLAKVEAEHTRAMNEIEASRAAELAEIAVRNREIMSSIAIVGLGAFVAVLFGGLCGALAFGAVWVLQRSKLPPSGKVAPGWIVVRNSNELKLLDVSTGALFSLAGERGSDQVRAGVEVARIQARVPEAVYIPEKVERLDKEVEIR